MLCARRVLAKLNLADTYEGVVDPTGELELTEEKDDAPRPFKCFLDVGLRRTTTGSRVFAVMKGASDGGLFIPHSENRFPGYDAEAKSLDAEVLRKYIYGGHVADYMRELEEEDGDRFKRQFGRFIEKKVTADDLETMYKSAHQKIRADPSFTATVKKAPKEGEKRKLYKKQRMNAKQRRDRIRQKMESFQAKLNA